MNDLKAKLEAKAKAKEADKLDEQMKDPAPPPADPTPPAEEEEPLDLSEKETLVRAYKRYTNTTIRWPNGKIRDPNSQGLYFAMSEEDALFFDHLIKTNVVEAIEVPLSSVLGG